MPEDLPPLTDGEIESFSENPARLSADEFKAIAQGCTDDMENTDWDSVHALEDHDRLQREFIDRLCRDLQRCREALKDAKDWARRIANDERVCDWVHQEDYGLYCLLADCDVDFDRALGDSQ